VQQPPRSPLAAFWALVAARSALFALPQSSFSTALPLPRAAFRNVILEPASLVGQYDLVFQARTWFGAGRCVALSSPQLLLSLGGGWHRFRCWSDCCPVSSFNILHDPVEDRGSAAPGRFQVSASFPGYQDSRGDRFPHPPQTDSSSVSLVNNTSGVCVRKPRLSVSFSILWNVATTKRPQFPQRQSRASCHETSGRTSPLSARLCWGIIWIRLNDLLAWTMMSWSTRFRASVSHARRDTLRYCSRRPFRVARMSRIRVSKWACRPRSFQRETPYDIVFGAEE